MDSQSHECLLLLPIKEVPVQTPFPSTGTHTPLSIYLPLPQTRQSLLVPPLHELHSDEQGVHVPESEYDPIGQVAPEEDVWVTTVHEFGSFEFWVYPALHEMQMPLFSAQLEQPS